MSLKTRVRQLGKDSLVYGIGGVAAKSVSFLLMAVYTRIFLPADYGSVTMLAALTSFLGIIVAMGMDSAQSFYFFEQKKAGKIAQARVITAILQWRLAWGLPMIAGALLLAPLLNRQFFDGTLTLPYFAMSFAGCLGNTLSIQSIELFRLRYHPWGYVSLALGETLLSAVIALLLIFVFDLGILGIVAGSAAGAWSIAWIGWRLNRSYLDWTCWHRAWWPRVLRFGAPLMPAGLAMYVLNTSDRWFISHYHGQDELGLYAVGANFAMFMTLAVTIFRQAWWPVALEAMHSAEGPTLFQVIARVYMGSGTAGVVLLTACSPWLVRWFTGPAFHAAYPIVGILAWHALFYGLYLIIVAGIWKMEKTIFAPVLMGIAALLNIGLDALLVPEYGSVGAAAATSCSFLVWSILTIWLSERLWRVGYHYRMLGFQLCIGVIASVSILHFYMQRYAVWAILPVAFLTACILGVSSLDRKHIALLRTVFVKT